MEEENTILNQPLKELVIDGYKYKYKDRYNNSFCYRCMFRATCKLTIIILFTEYIKYIKAKDKTTKLSFKVNSKQQSHSCLIKKEKEAELKNIINQKEEYELAIRLIKTNLDNQPSFHFNNLHNNNIFWPKKKIERILYKLKEEKYPVDNIFFKELNSQYIYLGDIKTDSNKFYIITKQIKFINNKGNKEEYLIFITTVFQLKLLNDVSILFIDDTFK